MRTVSDMEFKEQLILLRYGDHFRGSCFVKIDF